MLPRLIRKIAPELETLARSDGQFSLTVAGVLFLARSPQQLLPTAYVTALRIPGIRHQCCAVRPKTY